MSIVYDLIKATQLPQVEQPDLERFIIANGNDLATAPMYFLLDKIQSAMEKAAAANVAVNGVVLNAQQAAQKAQTAYLAGQELQENTFDSEGYYYADKIRPLSIDTTLISLGARSQQFSLPGVNFTLNTDFTSLTWTTGQIIHQTIDEPNLRTWDIAGGTVSTPVGFLNIYVKALKVGTTATIIATTDQLTVDEDASYFHFKVGYISSLINDVRIIKTTYGFAQINPAEISIGRISSPTGGNYIDLLYDKIVINGRVIFTSGSSGYDNLTDKPDLSPYDDAYDYIYGDLQSTLTALQAQADGAIETWFMNGVPTLLNLPASDWTTEALKEVHEGDLYFNKDTGLSYRFFKNGSVWGWEQVADQASQFMTELSEMQEALDGKMKVFVNTPTAPYQIGDLWLKGGELWRATTAKTEGQTYNIADWVHAVKYTDDSALNTFIDITYFSDQANLQSQIDGKIDTWFTNSDPSGEWTPAEKTAHTGDMWYNNTAKELKRWNGASWDLIQDQTALSAYQAASEAQDTADGKRTVFVAQPTTAQAYDVGDLWVNATVGSYVNEILRAQTAKASGATFNLGHWVKASKYTDDTRAEQIRTELQGTISDSQQAAKQYADDELAAQKTILKAYADGVADSAELAAIAEAETKAQAARDYAFSQDNLLRTELEVYADGKVDEEEQARLQQAEDIVAANKAYTDLLVQYTKEAQKAYLDGRLDDEETKLLGTLSIELAQARAYAEQLNSKISIGAKNLLREYNTMFNWKYWGNSGSGNEYDLDTLDPVEVFAMEVVVGANEFAMEHESGLIFEIMI